MSEFVPVLAVADLPPGQAAEVNVGGPGGRLFNVGRDVPRPHRPLPAPGRAARPGLRGGLRR